MLLHFTLSCVGCDRVEISESDVVISLCPIKENKFAYSLINGEVGVYAGRNGRLWRIKVRYWSVPCMYV